MAKMAGRSYLLEQLLLMMLKLSHHVCGSNVIVV